MKSTAEASFKKTGVYGPQEFMILFFFCKSYLCNNATAAKQYDTKTETLRN